MALTPSATLDSATVSVRQATRWAVVHGTARVVMRRLAHKGDLQGRMFTATRSEELFPLFEEIRDAGAVYRGRFGYATTSHDLVKQALASTDYEVGFPREHLPGLVRRVLSWSEQGVPVGR